VRGFAERTPWFWPVIAAWVISRVLLLAATSVTVWLVRHHFYRPRLPDLVTHGQPFTIPNLLGSWDGEWYHKIAVTGYPGSLHGTHQSPYAFFPLLPMLMRAGTWIGLSPQTAGIVIVNLAALGALVAIAALTESVLGVDLADRTALYVAVAPMGFVLGMVYTDALVMACAFGAAALVLRDRPWFALPLAFAAGLTRPTGILIVIPLAAIAFANRRLDWRRGLVALAPLAGFGVFALYCTIRVGNPLAFIEAQHGWGRHAIGLHSLRLAWHDVRTGIEGKKIWLTRDVLGTIVTVILLVLAAVRRVPWYWVAFGVMTLIVSPPTGTFLAMARYALYCLPAYWALAMLGRRWFADRAYMVLAPALFALSVMLLPIANP
jgi:hypothetical protein